MKSMNKQIDTLTFPTGSILAGNYYSTNEVQKILDIGTWSLDKWKANGLAYMRVGNGFLFEGADIISYIRNHKTRKAEQE